MQIVYIPIQRFLTDGKKPEPTCFTHAENAACVFFRVSSGGPAVCRSPIAGVADQFVFAKNGYFQPHEQCAAWADNAVEELP